MITPRPADDALRIVLTGDVMLGRLVSGAIGREGPGYPWGDVLPHLRAADLVLINLECALTASSEPWHDGDYKLFYFRADPDAVEVLRAGHVRFASLANNHVGDFGVDGLMETIRVLDAAGIAHAGAGRSLREARAPALLESRGVRVAVLAYADHPHAWRAEEDLPGCNYTPVDTEPEDFAPVGRSIAAARAEADLVIFSIHWGPNMREDPSDAFVRFAHAVVDAGADVFWGHSAHVLQGVEVYRDRLVVYDAGDFVDDYAVDPQLRNDLSALLVVTARGSRVERLDVLPTRIEGMQVNAAHDEEGELLLRLLERRSARFGTRLLRTTGGATVQVAPPA